MAKYSLTSFLIVASVLGWVVAIVYFTKLAYLLWQQ